jgi:uncharacterized delta-60 repeat protein
VRVGPDGKLYAAGSLSDGVAGFLARLSSQGVLDSTFDGDGIVIGSIAGEFAYANALGDGSIIVSAYVPADNAVSLAWPPDPAIAKYLSNGSPDTSFGVNGFSKRSLSTLDDKVRSLLIDSQGRYLSGGWHSNVISPSSNADACVLRWLSSGSPDSSFGVGDYVCIPFGGGGGNEFTRNLIDGGSDRIMVIGSGPLTSDQAVLTSGVARLLSNGTLDASFGNAGIWELTSPVATNELLGGVRDPSTGVMYFAGYLNSGASTGNDVLLVALNP